MADEKERLAQSQRLAHHLVPKQHGNGKIQQ